MSITQWIDIHFRPNKMFSDHFSMSHHFHGIQVHHISESYIIRPKSNMALQFFYEGVQFPYTDLHLLCQIDSLPEELKIQFEVMNPAESQRMMEDIKSLVLEQFILFEKRLNTDPTLNYVQSYCKNCTHQHSKPFNICVKTCRFEQKKQKQHKH